MMSGSSFSAILQVTTLPVTASPNQNFTSEFTTGLGVRVLQAVRRLLGRKD